MLAVAAREKKRGEEIAPACCVNATRSSGAETTVAGTEFPRTALPLMSQSITFHYAIAKRC